MSIVPHINIDNIDFNALSFTSPRQTYRHTVDFIPGLRPTLGRTVWFEIPRIGDYHLHHRDNEQNEPFSDIDKKDIKKIINEDLECSVCLEEVFYGTELVCNHKFCFDCIQKIDNDLYLDNKKCPLCRGKFEILDHFKTKAQKIKDNIEEKRVRKNKSQSKPKSKEERKIEKKKQKEQEIREKGLKKVAIEKEMKKKAWRAQRGRR